MPNTVDSVVTCDDFLETRIWKQGISTTGLRKQCLVTLSTYVSDISIELETVRQEHSWRSQRLKRRKWWWKRRGSQRKYLYLIIVPMGQLWWITHKKEKDGKERKKLQLHHTTIGLHGCSLPPAWGKEKTVHTDHNNGSPWWDSTTDFLLRYCKKNWTVYLMFELKLKLTMKTCCLVIKETVYPLIQYADLLII